MNIKWENINDVLRNSAQLLQDYLVDGILNKGLLKTGKLANSVRVEFREGEDESRFLISMEDYGYYQDSGVQGTKSGYPSDANSLFPQGRFKSKTIGGPLPFAVRQSIAQKGFRPRPFIVPSVNQMVTNLQSPLEAAGEEDLNLEIIELFKENGAIV